MRISDWSSDVCSSDLEGRVDQRALLQDRALAVELARQLGKQRCQQTAPRQLLAEPEDRRVVGRVVLQRQAGEAAERQPIEQRLLHRRVRQVVPRSEETTSELQSLMRIAYAVSCLK